MTDVYELINSKLDALEAEHSVRVLYAVESGSRAWGFASPDSDYDVRFIYVRPRDEYLRLDHTDDVIEYEINDIMDIVGWDIAKALKLFHKSNPSLLEWLGSPILYRTTIVFEGLRPLLAEYYQRRHGLYHYRSMAKKNFVADFKNDQVRLKQYFYVIRPILACKWILNNDTPPPVLFSDLVANALEPELLPDMGDLLKRKSDTNESEKQVRIVLWDNWIQENLALLEGAAENAEPDNKMPWSRLNTAFLDILAHED